MIMGLQDMEGGLNSNLKILLIYINLDILTCIVTSLSIKLLHKIPSIQKFKIEINSLLHKKWAENA